MALLDIDQWSVDNWRYYALRCSRCGEPSADVALRPAMTQYADEKLNLPLLLCAPCADNYYAYWQAQWDEYNASRR